MLLQKVILGKFPLLQDNEMLKRQTESMTPKCNCGRLSLFFLFIFLIIGVRTGRMRNCVIVDTTTVVKRNLCLQLLMTYILACSLKWSIVSTNA